MNHKYMITHNQLFPGQYQLPNKQIGSNNRPKSD